MSKGEWQDAPYEHTQVNFVDGEIKTVKQVQIGAELFQFTSFIQWVNKASGWYSSHGVSAKSTLAIDAKGRICLCGKHMQIARDENAFPVKVFLVRSDL